MTGHPKKFSPRQAKEIIAQASLRRERQGWVWNTFKQKAAVCVAQGRTDAFTEGYACCTSLQLSRWRRHPEFKKEVARQLEIYHEKVINQGIVMQTRRFDTYNKDWEATETILRERGIDLASIPGGSTGYITTDYKGADNHEVAEFDQALFRERRLLREQVAKETGQWLDKSTAPASAPTTIQIVYVDKQSPQAAAEQAKAIDTTYTNGFPGGNGHA